MRQRSARRIAFHIGRKPGVHRGAEDGILVKTSVRVQRKKARDPCSCSVVALTSHRNNPLFSSPCICYPAVIRPGVRFMKDWKTPLRAAIIGAVTATAFGLAAFFLLTTWHSGMGSALFFFTPVVAGFSIALVADGENSAVAAAMISIAATLGMLIAFGKEGGLCALLALPIIGVALAVGVVLGSVTRKLLFPRTENQTMTMGILLLTGPALIFATNWIERPLLQVPRFEVITTSVKVEESPEHVWNHILTVDNVAASKPFLMHIGLPIPERCSLVGRGVGAKRTCYFNNGYIEETITVWNPPFYVGLNIDRT